MIQIRKANERGHAQHGWLESYHTFSFADYHDPKQMGFRTLRVINEDRVQPGKGFATHSHRDMEIISYVLDGALEHKDSMGNGSVIRPGDLQLMRAGTGVTHSEYNASNDQLVHFLQIWILPDAQGLAPAYEQRHFPIEARCNTLLPVVSRHGQTGALHIRQDAAVYASILEQGHSVAYVPAENRHVWLQLVHGSVRLNDVVMQEGDGAAVTGESHLEISADAASEFLLFDLG